MVSIIIINHNQKNFLKQCLRNIQEAKIKLAYEIIVVDNDSRNGSKEFLTSIQDPVSSIRVF